MKKLKRDALAAFLSASIFCASGCLPVPQGGSQAVGAKTTRESQPHVFEPWTFTPRDQASIAENFIGRLNMAVFHCGLEALSGRTAARYSSPSKVAEYQLASSQCHAYAMSQGDLAIASLKQGRIDQRQYELAQSMYAEWSRFISGMSIYEPHDYEAESRYRIAESALSAEIKFSR